MPVSFPLEESLKIFAGEICLKITCQIHEKNAYLAGYLFIQLQLWQAAEKARNWKTSTNRYHPFP